MLLFWVHFILAQTNQLFNHHIAQKMLWKDFLFLVSILLQHLLSLIILFCVILSGNQPRDGICEAPCYFLALLRRCFLGGIVPVLSQGVGDDNYDNYGDRPNDFDT